MDREALRAFVSRDWASAQRAKMDYWSERYWRDGSGPARHASTVLLEHACRIGALPADAQRAADLAHHLAVRDRLDRAARALARR